MNLPPDCAGFAPMTMFHGEHESSFGHQIKKTASAVFFRPPKSRVLRLCVGERSGFRGPNCFGLRRPNGLSSCSTLKKDLPWRASRGRASATKCDRVIRTSERSEQIQQFQPPRKYKHKHPRAFTASFAPNTAPLFVLYRIIFAPQSQAVEDTRRCSA